MSAARDIQNEPDAYAAIRELDGRHPYKEAVPSGFVDYQVRARRGGKVVYFNFALAEEMGLVPRGAPHRLTKALKKTLLDTFAIQIINEYDLIHGLKVARQDVKPHRYMATRYLQLQHPDKRGMTSGDGRSIWNGSVTRKGVTWDVSSCGTGATSLSPATAIEKRYFRTGDPVVAYGCGSADLQAGLSAAMFSEILHESSVPTERTLVVIGFKKGLAINVRASKNLLRPSHLFLHLRQGNYVALRSAVDYFIDRQTANGERDYKAAVTTKQRYTLYGEKMARAFAESAAIFESQYIFVWMDWDGDNILCDGGIIDYGSVRQFGLFHQEYRYDDVDRWSTSLVEQKAKARDIVQTFAQMLGFLRTGEQRDRKEFGDDPLLSLFDRTFQEKMLALLLEKTGFDAPQREHLMRYHRPLVEGFRRHHARFERAKSPRGLRKVVDGITWDAIYSMRDLLRELPRTYAEAGRPEAKAFMELMASSYAKRGDRKLTPARLRQIQTFCAHYEALVRAAGRKARKSEKRLFAEMAARTAVGNRADRATGNAIILMADRLAREGLKLPQEQLQELMEAVIAQQITSPERAGQEIARLKGPAKPLARICLRLLKEYRDGI